MNIKLIAVFPKGDQTHRKRKPSVCHVLTKIQKKEIVSPLPTKINAIMRKKAIMNIHVSTRRKMKIPSWNHLRKREGTDKK